MSLNALNSLLEKKGLKADFRQKQRILSSRLTLEDAIDKEFAPGPVQSQLPQLQMGGRERLYNDPKEYEAAVKAREDSLMLHNESVWKENYWTGDKINSSKPGSNGHIVHVVLKDKGRLPYSNALADSINVNREPFGITGGVTNIYQDEYRRPNGSFGSYQTDFPHIKPQYVRHIQNSYTTTDSSGRPLKQLGEGPYGRYERENFVPMYKKPVEIPRLRTMAIPKMGMEKKPEWFKQAREIDRMKQYPKPEGPKQNMSTAKLYGNPNVKYQTGGQYDPTPVSTSRKSGWTFP